MKFKLTGTAIFEAENIDGAFKKLAEHFSSLATEDGKGIEMLAGTDLHLEPTAK